MAGKPIRISVITDAVSALRGLAAVSRAVQSLNKVPGLTFNTAKYKADYSNPFLAATRTTVGAAVAENKSMYADIDQARKFFARKAAKEPVGKAPKFTADKDVSFKRAFQNYKALGGEARVTLEQINKRIAHFEQVGTDAYTKVSGKLEQYKDTADSTVGKLKVLALATAAVSVAGRGISAATGYLKTAVSNASSLNETVNKTQVIFKGNTAAVVAYANTAARSLGLSKQAALEATSGFGDLAIQLGFSQQAALKFATGNVTLASDLASFSNLDVSDVNERLAAGYRGEFDGLQKLVPAITAARVQTEALALSHKKSAKQLTAQDTALAVNAIVMHDTARAQGDFGRTSNQLANSVRENKAGLSNLSATIGTALLPGVLALSLAFRDHVLPPLTRLAEKDGPKVSKFLTKLANTTLPKLTAQLNGTDAGKPFANLKPGDLGKASDAIGRLGSSFVALSGPTGTGVIDTLSVFSIVIKTVADHTKLLAKLMPLLITSYIAYKLAVAAAAAAEVLKLPTKILEIVVNRQLIASNKALIASRLGETAAVTENVVAENVNTVSKERGIIATVASRVAMLAGAAATGALTVATGALNLVMSLNPVVLVVIAVLALAAAFIYAYKHSERFRVVVNAVFGALKSGVLAAIGFVRKNWPVILAVLTGPVGLAVLAFTKYKTRIIGVFTSIKNTVVSVFASIGNVITSALKAAVNEAISLINEPLRAINNIAGKVPGVPDLPLIPALAAGGIVRARRGGTLVRLGEAGRDEVVIPLGSGRYGGDVITYNVTVNTGIGNPVEIGKAIVNSVRAYERSKGQRVLSNAA